VIILLWLLVRWVVLAGAVALTAWVMPDVAIEGGVWATVWVALLISLANVVVQGLMLFLPTPGSVLVLAALTLAVNGLAVWAVSELSSALDVDGFWSAVGAALLISVFSVALSALALRLLPEQTPDTPDAAATA
jgi:putative membrane protein